MQSDLKNIKKKYSESFAHLCRELFPTLLETEGLLYSLIESNFYPSKFLYSDIVNNNLKADFQRFINSLVDTKEEIEINTNKTPKELLDSVGYTLYECKTEEDIQRFKKYYAKGEELCTFRGGRLNSCYVFFAVKKNVADIKRENFTNPQRQDGYGTSVISIQFTKYAQSTISIKNRYNHTVNNPDSTFSNNLENIVCGLTRSFEITYDLDIKKSNQQNFEIPGYVCASDGKFYKYNYEINNTYYCPDNIIIDNFEIKKYEKDRYIVFDYFILDMKSKKLKLYDIFIKDSFLTGLNIINKVQIKKSEDRKYICLDIGEQPITIGLDKENRIISYCNNNITQLDDNFLYHNIVMKTLYLENLRRIGDSFLASNSDLELIDVPLLNEIGRNFLTHNLLLSEIVMPYLKKVGNDFIPYNRSISEIYLPSLEEIGNEFLTSNTRLKKLILPRLKKAGNLFMYNNKKLEILELPRLESIGKGYLEHNRIISEVVVPQDIWNTFIYNSGFASNFKSKQKKLGTMSTKQY